MVRWVRRHFLLDGQYSNIIFTRMEVTLAVPRLQQLEREDTIPILDVEMHGY
jgi:hypothetical protein